MSIMKGEVNINASSMNTIDTAVILAGGLGTRLHPLTLTLPKPMLPIADKPVLEYIIEWLKGYGINNIIVCISYLGNIIEGYFNDGKEYGVNILYAKTKRPLGTAGQLKSAEHLINNSNNSNSKRVERFVCLYGDSIYNFNLKDMIDKHLSTKALATIALMPYKIRLDYGFIDVDKDGNVIAWNEKPEVKGLINIGCYIMDKEFLELIPKDTVVAMNTVFIDAIKKGKKVNAYITNEDSFKDIGNRRTYGKVYKEYLRRLGEI
jgi:mannose-1-phosphate guanylyltransferase